MGKGRHKLKPLQVERMKKPGRYGDGHGLYLVVRQSGSKAWSYVWIRQGLRREMGLGGFPGVDLIKARQKADFIRSHIADGLDPASERDKDVTMKFSEVVELVLEKKRKTWTSDKHGAQWERALKVLCKPLHSVLVNEIDTPHVLRVLNPVWEKTPETGRRLRLSLIHI